MQMITNIIEETSIDILCRCRVLGVEDRVIWMIFKKATPTPTNILRMLANGYVDVDVLRINMLSSVFPSVAVQWVYIEKLWGVG